MNAGQIFTLEFPFQQGQGIKYRPVLVFVLTSTANEFIGLKITRTPREDNRIEIIHWQEAGLDYKSYVQCDNYSVFQVTGNTKLVGSLNQDDYDRIVLKFNEFYPILEWQKEYDEANL